MRRVRRVVRDHGDAIEADLRRFYQVDLRDLWRRDADGRRRLTWRQLGVFIRHLPDDAATNKALSDGLWEWDRQTVLLADIWQAVAQSKRPHPALADAMSTVKRSSAPRRFSDKAKAAASARRAERQRQIDAGEIT